MSQIDCGTAAGIGWDFLEGQATIVLLQVDAEGTVLSANSYAKALLGPSLLDASLRELLVGSVDQVDLRHWLTPSDEPRIMNVRTHSGLPQTLYVTTVPVGSRLLLFGQTDPLEQERLRSGFLELNHELTALSRELAQANAELGRLNEMKNKFLGMASHDLRKPAALILNCAELLLDDAAADLSPYALQNLRHIVDSASSMSHLIDDFLDVSVIESGHLVLDLQVVEQKALVASAFALVQLAAAKRGIKLTAHLDKSMSRLLVDGPKIEQVLTNLFSNAIDHSPDQAVITVRSLLQGDEIRFLVEDPGPGVNLELQHHLFEAFSGKGGLKPGGERSIGLGLVIVRKIVEAHGGSCFVESLPGFGSCFGFVLPAGCRAVKGGHRQHTGDAGA